MKNENSLPVVWTVAGSDNGAGAGAGIQADLRAFDAFGGVHGCTVVGAITAQNSVEVALAEAVDGRLLEAQLDALSRDLRPAVIKTGLLGSAANLHVLVRCIDRLRAADPLLAVVVDPVLRAPTGVALADEGLLAAYRTELLPRATLVTPNRSEAAALLGLPTLDDDPGEIEAATHALLALGCEAAVITGGYAIADKISEDFMLTREAGGWLVLPRVATRDNHGTGRVFAASAAAAMARGFVSADAVILAKMATAHALRQGGPAGAGAGPVLPDDDFAGRIENLPKLLLPLPPSARDIEFAPLANPRMELYAVVDSAVWVRRMLDAGVRCVQLRIKDAAHPRLREEIRDAVAAARAVRAQLFINDHWQLAVEEGAYGVHLGQDDLQTADLAQIASAGLRLGVSSHAYWEVCRALALKPSYIACGPIHATDSKAMPWIPQGNGNLAYWCALLAPTPVVAIAGMDFERAAQAVRSGASGVAVITAITQAASPERAIEEFTRSIEAARQQSPLHWLALPRPTLARRT